MKIVVFADSHTDVRTMGSVVQKEKPHLVIHLGDHITDGLRLQDMYPDIPMEFVVGNTDSIPGYPYEKTIEHKGKKIYMTHGDRYDVHLGLSRIFYKGESTGADIILFGHTHLAYLENKTGILMMNPGRIGRVSRNTIDATYGVIQLEDDHITCSIEKVL